MKIHLTVPQLILLADALRDGRVVVSGAELLTARALRRMDLLQQVAGRTYAPTDRAQAALDSQARASD